MTTYLARTTFGSFRFEANLAEASAPIFSLPDRGDDETESFPTPYQTADARHNERTAALLVLEYFGSEYWLDPDAVRDETEDGETTYDGKTRSEYLDGLLVSIEAQAE